MYSVNTLIYDDFSTVAEIILAEKDERVAAEKVASLFLCVQQQTEQLCTLFDRIFTELT